MTEGITIINRVYTNYKYCYFQCIQNIKLTLIDTNKKLINFKHLTIIFYIIYFKDFH